MGEVKPKVQGEGMLCWLLMLYYFLQWIFFIIWIHQLYNGENFFLWNESVEKKYCQKLYAINTKITKVRSKYRTNSPRTIDELRRCSFIRFPLHSSDSRQVSDKLNRMSGSKNSIMVFVCFRFLCRCQTLVQRCFEHRNRDIKTWEKVSIVLNVIFFPQLCWKHPKNFREVKDLEYYWKLF